MKEILLVGLGGFTGSVCRYLLSLFIHEKTNNHSFPFGILIINISGCLLIGFLAGLWEKIPTLPSDWRLFLATGILGGFTTFSTFSLDTFTLLRNNELTLALIYAGGSVFLGILAAILGFYITKLF